MTETNQKHMTRRNFLATGGILLAGAIPGCSVFGTGGKAGSLQAIPARKRVLRFAHLTDIHLRDQRVAIDGFTAALHHLQNLEDRPELIITGGDLINNGNRTADTEWPLFKKTLNQECSLPVRHCLGNHDMCEWAPLEKHQIASEIYWSKERPVQELDLPHRYYHFDQAGWRFIILDSMGKYPEKNYYYGRLDEEQFQWLAQTLQNTPESTPLIIVSHIAILTAAVFDLAKVQDEQFRVDNCEIHDDTKKIRALFRQYPNVKLCLSGHLHLFDRVMYDGLTYICDGAVCGRWWQGTFHGTEEGYGLVDLYSDGTFEHRYQHYGWKPSAM